MLHKGQRIRHITDSILKKARIEPKIALTLRNYETAQALVSQGLGVTFLPEDYTRIILGDNPPDFFSIHKKPRNLNSPNVSVFYIHHIAFNHK